MKLTKETLKRIIKEELGKVMSEAISPMRGMMKYQPEMEKDGVEPYIPESLVFDLDGQSGKLEGRQAPIIAIISFQEAKESGDQEEMERQAKNAMNVWSFELNMKDNPEKQESFKQGLLTGSINFKVNQEIFRYRQSKKRR